MEAFNSRSLCESLLLLRFVLGVLAAETLHAAAVSSNFCLPVKNGWQFEQISTWMSPLWVDRVVKLLPHAHIHADFVVTGWIAAFMGL